MSWRLVAVCVAVLAVSLVALWLISPSAAAPVAVVAAAEAARRAAKRARASATRVEDLDALDATHARWIATDDENAVEVEMVRSDAKRSRLAELRAKLSRRG